MYGFFYIFDSEFGKLKIESSGNYIVKIEFNNILSEKILKLTPLIEKTFLEIDSFFKGERKTFTIPIKLNGTDFQKKVWGELLKIEYGKTLSYKDIAIRIENPKACRAVGMANNKNPLPILVPCHRVVGANGALVGYAGGLNMKEKLLILESK